MVPLRLEATHRPRLKMIWDVPASAAHRLGHVEAWVAIAAAFSSSADSVPMSARRHVGVTKRPEIPAVQRWGADHVGQS
jgi:hypothetical protein